MTEEKWIENYNKNFNYTSNTEDTYEIRIEKLIDEYKITEEKFKTKTGLDHMSYIRFRTGKIPSLQKLIAICVVFEIDIQTLIGLLRSLGRTFKLTDPKHYAYYKLVEDYKGRTIPECNELLKKIGITQKKDLLPDPLSK